MAILDADKEGYLRSATSLIQTMGRCARHIKRARSSMRMDDGFDGHAIDETNRRRAKQTAYNVEHHITPESIIKSVDMQLATIVEADYMTVPADDVAVDDLASEEELRHAIEQLEAQMREAAKKFEFERAASLRDRVRALRQRDFTAIFSASPIEIEAAGSESGPEPPSAASSAAAGDEAVAPATPAPKAAKRARK